MNLLMINVAPTFLARRGYLGRRRINDAFLQYFSRSPIGRSSALIEARYKTAVKYGMSPAGISQTEIGTLIGLLINAIPTTFYMLHYIYSDEAVLHNIRAEVEACIASEVINQLRLDTIKLRDHCPLLLSTFQEVLRIHNRGASVRLVLDDTMLNEQYLLKKNAIVLMPTAVIHTEPSVWGPSAFNARRFLKTEQTKRSSSEASYHPFGGGSTLCPGRHFAAAEVLGLTAMLVYQYEVQPVLGEWRLPPAVQPNMAINVFPPKTDVRVWMRAREGLGDVEWVL